MKKLLLLGTLLLAPVSLCAQDVGAAIGSKPAAPVVQDLDGKAVNLAQYVGRQPVLIEFWATWCPLCRAMEPQLAAAQRKYGKKVQFLIMGVGVNQTPRSIKRHLARTALPGKVLWDGTGAAVRAFDAPGTSYIVILDRQGRVIYTGSGSEQKLLPVLAGL